MSRSSPRWVFWGVVVLGAGAVFLASGTRTPAIDAATAAPPAFSAWRRLGGRETGAGIVALDKNTGQTLWAATRDGASCSTARAATIHGLRQVFVWTAEALVSVDPANGVREMRGRKMEYCSVRDELP